MKMMNKIKVLFITIMFASAFFFSGCTLPEDEKKDALKILEIREALTNNGQINKLALIFSDDFPDRKEYLDQLKYRHFYFTEYEYNINSIKFLSYNPLTKKAVTQINFDTNFKLPEDPASTVFLGKLEKVTLKKEKIGWKIDEIEEIKESGKKIASQLVHDIFFPLDTRKIAISNSDYALFESVIHPDFATREELLSDFKKNAEVFSEINYALKSRQLLSISEDKQHAEVVQYFDLVFKTKDGNVSQKLENQKEIISLKKNSKGIWQIVAGLK